MVAKLFFSCWQHSVFLVTGGSHCPLSLADVLLEQQNCPMFSSQFICKTSLFHVHVLSFQRPENTQCLENLAVVSLICISLGFRWRWLWLFFFLALRYHWYLTPLEITMKFSYFNLHNSSNFCLFYFSLLYFLISTNIGLFN